MNKHSDRMIRRGFTLVELLVVIGIIALLISILLPALSKARLQAKRTMDLSNIRQLAVACINYSAENHGLLPLGNRQGPNLTNPPSSSDDLVWINSYTFAYFLSFMNSPSVARNWLSTSAPYPNGMALDSSQKARFTCTSLMDSPDGGTLAASVGELTYRFYSPQTDPNGAGTTETYMGFIYWGNRADVVAGGIYDQNGNVAQPATAYKFPKKTGDRPTSRTLLTCPCYVSTGYGLQMPHCNKNDAYVRKGPNVSTPGNGINDPTAIMQGLHIAYTDGSARWVPRRQLWSMFEGSTVSGNSLSGGFDWLYFDHTN